jgi:hypothetical protein
MIARSATLVSLEISQLGLSMKDLPVTTAAHQAVGISNKRAGYYRKFKIDRNDVRDVIRVAQNARAYHRTMTVPWGRDVYRMLPAPLIIKYTRGLKDFKREFYANIDDVVLRWPTILANSQSRLGSAYNADDYFAAKEIKAQYDFEIHFKPVPLDDHFILEVERETLEELKDQFNVDQDKNMKEAMTNLWHRLHGVVSNMATQLENAKPTIFKTLVTNIEDLVEILPALNLDNDPKLTTMIQTVKDELTGYTPGQLKKSKKARNNTAKTAKKIQKDMEAIMGTSTK